MQETQVQCLGQEDPLEKEIAIHFNILAWRIPWTVEFLVGYSPWGHKEWDITERLTLHFTDVSLRREKYFLLLTLTLLLLLFNRFISVQFSSVTQLCPTLCDPMNCSRPGLPVHHQLPEFTQTHVHRVGDAIQPSHLLSSPSPPAPNPSQHQSLCQ